jgi:hypothetical protein
LARESGGRSAENASAGEHGLGVFDVDPVDLIFARAREPEIGGRA